MNVLIVEDNQFKLQQIKEFLSSKYPEIILSERYSYNSGLRAILLNNIYDLIILDMSLPNYDINQSESGGDFIPLAGELILGQLDRKELQTKALVVTMYESFVDGTKLSELDQRIKIKYPKNYLGFVFLALVTTNGKLN